MSKALPHSRFDNSDEVVAAMHTRVVSESGRRILERLEATGRR